MRPRVNIAVETTTGHTVPYEAVTEIRIDRGGNLRVYDGWRQRAYHPRGQWRAYGVARCDLQPKSESTAESAAKGCPFPGCGCGGRGTTHHATHGVN